MTPSTPLLLCWIAGAPSQACLRAACVLDRPATPHFFTHGTAGICARIGTWKASVRSCLGPFVATANQSKAPTPYISLTCCRGSQGPCGKLFGQLWSGLVNLSRALCSVEWFGRSFWQRPVIDFGNHWPHLASCASLDNWMKGRAAGQEFNQKDPAC